MNTHRLFLFLIGLALLTVPAVTAHAADQVSVHAILVAASNEKGQTDRRLAQYEPTLRRILRFESYRFLGDGGATVAVDDQKNLSLGEGHQLEVGAEPSGGRGMRVKVRWTGGGRTLLTTVLNLSPGVPAVLGGPARGENEVYAVIVIGR